MLWPVRPQHTEHATRTVQILNQWLCEQLYELSWRWACGPETCRDPAIYEQNSDISWFSFHMITSCYSYWITQNQGLQTLSTAIKTFHMVQRQRAKANPCSLVSSYFLIIVVIVSELMCTDAVNFRVKSTPTPLAQDPHSSLTPVFSCSSWYRYLLHPHSSMPL